MEKAKEVSNEIKKLIIKAMEKNVKKKYELYDDSEPGISHIIKVFPE